MAIATEFNLVQDIYSQVVDAERLLKNRSHYGIKRMLNNLNANKFELLGNGYKIKHDKYGFYDTIYIDSRNKVRVFTKRNKEVRLADIPPKHLFEMFKAVCETKNL